MSTIIGAPNLIDVYSEGVSTWVRTEWHSAHPLSIVLHLTAEFSALLALKCKLGPLDARF